MTIALTPGCFQSLLFYRAVAPECVACPLHRQCREALLERAPRVVKTVGQLDVRFDQESAPDLAPWIKKRLRRPDTSAAERKQSKARETLESWKRVGLNVYELRHKMNPAFPTEPGLRAAFQSVIDNGAGFSRRDLTEDVRINANLTKVSATCLVNTVCDALLEAGVIKSENRGILCLNH